MKTEKQEPVSSEECQTPMIPKKIILKDEITSQQFSFPKPTVHYLLENANIELIKKLQQTCLFFYSKFPFRIVDSLELSLWNPEIHKYKKRTTYSNNKMEYYDYQITNLPNNLYLTNFLYISPPINVEFESILRPKITKCDIKEFSFFGEKLTIMDFKFLASSGMLEKISIYACVVNADGSIVPLEEIFQYIPNVYRYQHLDCKLTAHTWTKMLMLKRNAKLRHFHIDGVDNESFQSHLFIDYLKKTSFFTDPPSTWIQLEGRNTDALQEIYDDLKGWREDVFFKFTILKFRMELFEMKTEKQEFVPSEECEIIPLSIPKKVILKKEITTQQFSFPKPTVHYLLENANIELIKKLQQTCLFFYSKFHFTIVRSLRIDLRRGNVPMEIESNRSMYYENNQLTFLPENLYLTGRFEIDLSKTLMKMEGILSSKITKNNIQVLELFYGKIFFTDFKFLTKSERLVKLDISFHCHIVNEDGSEVPLEEIFPCIPNVYDFGQWNCKFTEQTWTKLCLLKRNTKLRKWKLRINDETFKCQQFFDYLKKTSFFNDPHLESFLFISGENEDIIDKIYERFEEWKPNSVKVTLRVPREFIAQNIIDGFSRNYKHGKKGIA